MKKKYIALMALPLLCGCQAPSYSVVDVSWKQNGKDCVYTEQLGEIRREWNFDTDAEEDKKYISVVKTLSYGNSSCEKIIDAELKNKTNKSALTNNFHQINSINRTNITTQMQSMY